MSALDTTAKPAAPAPDSPPASPARKGIGGLWSRSTLLRHLTITVGIGIALYSLTDAIDPFRSYQLATVCAYLCATAGLTILTGRNGQLSLGHGALMAVGAYTVALTQGWFSDNNLTSGWLLAVSLLLAVLVTVVIGAVIGLAAARLRGPYLAGVTLAVAVVIPAFTTTFDEIFNSDQGLSVPVQPPPAALGRYFPVERWQAWIALACALLTMLLLSNLVRSRFGREMRAVRDDEVAARLSGIAVARTQVITFVVSAATAGLGGGLLAFFAQSVSPGAFSLTLSLFLLMAVVIGGLGSLAGAVWGAILLVALPDVLHRVTDGIAVSPQLAQRLEGNLPLAIFGITLIVVMITAPRGVQGGLSRAARALRALLHR